MRTDKYATTDYKFYGNVITIQVLSWNFVDLCHEGIIPKI